MDLHSAQSKMMCLWHKMARRTAISERVPLVDAFFRLQAIRKLGDATPQYFVQGGLAPPWHLDPPRSVLSKLFF